MSAHGQDAAAPRLALTLLGGGARGAYQAGVLERLSQALPELRLGIITGVSAGAINAAYLANSPATFAGAARSLQALWAGLSMEQVVRAATVEMLGNVARWSAQLLSGGIQPLTQAQGLLDTAPLRSLLQRALDATDGPLAGVERNLAAGRLDALAVTTTSYQTGQAITFAQQPPGHSVAWQRPQRLGCNARIGIDHVMASAAIPLLFPAIQIDGSWHGDGSVRDTAPLSPALHLGAERILVISTVRGALGVGEPTATEPAAIESAYPSLARIVGVTLNSILYGHMESDAAQMRRFTELARTCAAARATGLRPVDVMVLRPSLDLGEIAAELEKELPRAIRYLTRGLGTREPNSADLVSAVLFEAKYTCRLIECGQHDAEQQLDALVQFLTAASVAPAG
ncbi:MAG: patatin-like phospholipase family protein [Deltaproteobacteria bacterium]